MCQTKSTKQNSMFYLPFNNKCCYITYHSNLLLLILIPLIKTIILNVFSLIQSEQKMPSQNIYKVYSFSRNSDCFWNASPYWGRVHQLTISINVAPFLSDSFFIPCNQICGSIIKTPYFQIKK